MYLSVIYQSVYHIFLFMCHLCIVSFYPYIIDLCFQHVHSRQDWDGCAISQYRELTKYSFIIGIQQ